MSSDRFYLLVRDNEHGRTSVQEFNEDVDAFAAYFEAERLHEVLHSRPESADLEVVLIAAESEQSVREGYPHYFTKGSRSERREDFARRLRELV